MSTIIYPQGTATVVLAANQSIAVFSKASAKVSRLLGYPNLPSTLSVLGTVTAGQTVFGPYASGATIVIEAGADVATYEAGIAPVTDEYLPNKFQGAPFALNATGAITAAGMLTGIVTSTTGAAVAGTVPTGATLDLAGSFAIGDSFDWSVIATGANAFTVTADTGHTLVGTAVVATVTSGRFRTRKTAADTWVSYRLS